MTAGRLEFKYCVPEQLATEILGEARKYLPPDPLAQGSRQRVTSLYLDTPDLLFLRWHHDRVDDRFKLRIRRYGEPPAGTLYTEIKRKIHSVVSKQRSPFHVDQLQTVVERCREASCVEPHVLVTCIRESLRDPHSENAVTADRALQYQPMRVPDLLGRDEAWRPLPLPRTTGETLLELKCGADAPLWMHSLLDALPASRVSFSKYAAAMAAASSRC